ncbi:hypothetical protein [Euzebya rosea]|uniref:hypothetical protein n=1 Tax=Euzebya rosea TaxID=2052804 RepID=UPI000D3ED258|nr:hypothetical protein [Euzebya rosea]
MAPTDVETTPISRDDLSRLVDRLDRASAFGTQCEMGRLAIWASHDTSPGGRERWMRVCDDLLTVDRLLAELIGSWDGAYKRFGAGGRYPKGDGVRLGLERICEGLRTVVARSRRHDLRRAAPVMQEILTRLVRTYLLMNRAYHASGGRRRLPPRPAASGWENLPAGSSAALTAAARRQAIDRAG